MVEVIVWVVLLGIVGFVIYQRSYIKKYSERYGKFLVVVNKLKRDEMRYKDRFSDSHAFDSKQKYDNVNNREKVFEEYLLRYKKELENSVKSINHNQDLMKKAEQEYSNLSDVPKVDKFKLMERVMLKSLYKSVRLDDDFSLHYETSYTSPKGQNHYESSMDLSLGELVHALEKIEEEKDERTEYEIFRDAERAKMTSGLRYDILKRDDFMCQMCGASADVHDVTLHVDHIKPVANGGKTEEDNLQTLCRDCNLGKGVKD